MTTTEPIEVTLAVTGVLERLGVEYLVGGSLATSLHGIPRATLDVDIVADLQMTHLAPFVAALQEAFFVDADMVRDAIRRRATFNILHLTTMRGRSAGRRAGAQTARAGLGRTASRCVRRQSRRHGLAEAHLVPRWRRRFGSTVGRRGWRDQNARGAVDTHVISMS